jgi:hypothetical protein
MITSGLTCSVRRSLAGDLLVTVAFHVRLTDEYQARDQQLQVSVNNNLNYGRVRIRRIMWIPTHLNMQQTTTHAQMDGRRFSMKKMTNDFIKFRCIKHRELSYIVRNTHRTNKIFQTKRIETNHQNTPALKLLPSSLRHAFFIRKAKVNNALLGYRFRSRNDWSILSECDVRPRSLYEGVTLDLRKEIES